MCINVTDLIKLSPVTLGAVVEHGIEHHNAHDVLVEVKAKPVKFSRASVEDQGVEVDPSNLDKLHEAVSQLSNRQLLHLGLDGHKEVTLEAGVGSSSKHISSTGDVPEVVAVVQVSRDILLHVSRDDVVLHGCTEVVLKVVVLHGSHEAALLHVGNIAVEEQSLLSNDIARLLSTDIVLCPGFGNDILLRPSLQVVLLHVAHELHVAKDQLLLLTTPARILLQMVWMEIQTRLTLGHIVAAHRYSEVTCTLQTYKEKNCQQQTFKEAL